jgi:hypothetical protein
MGTPRISAARLRAGHDLHRAGDDLDLHPLARRADRRLHIVRHADASQTAVLPSGLKIVPAGKLQGAFHVRVKVSAVEYQPGGGAVRQLVLAYQVATADLGAVDREPARGHVEEPLDHMIRLRPAGAAEWHRRKRVGDDAAHFDAGGRHAIHRGQDVLEVDHRHERHGVRPDVCLGLDLVGEDACVGVEAERSARHAVAALEVRDERFRALGGPFHRPPEPARRPDDHRLLGMNVGARAERSSYILGHDTNGLPFDSKNFGKYLLHPVDALAAGDERVASILVIGHRRARLDRAARDSLVDELVAHDERCAIERALHSRLVAHRAAKARSALRWQRLVLHFHALGGVARRVARLGDQRRNRLAHMARFAARQWPVRTLERIVESGPVDVECLHGIRNVADRQQPVGRVVLAGKEREAVACRSDRNNARVGMRRAHERAPELSRQRDIVGEAPFPGQQPVVLQARERPADQHVRAAPW